MWLIVGLILVGIVLLVAELVLLPGISVAGIGAIAALIAAVLYAFIQYGIFVGTVTLTVTVVAAVGAVIISLRANTWRRFSLDTTIDATSSPTPQQHHIAVGQQAQTMTRLAPMGKISINGVIVEAKAVDRYVDPHSVVEVIGFDNTAVVVREVSPMNQKEKFE